MKKKTPHFYFPRPDNISTILTGLKYRLNDTFSNLQAEGMILRQKRRYDKYRQTTGKYFNWLRYPPWISLETLRPVRQQQAE